MPIYLKSLALKNYRGIGDEFEKMPSFKSFNLFIGSNNAGKSTVLNFISGYLPPTFAHPTFGHTQPPKPLSPLEKNLAAGGKDIEVGLGVSCDDAFENVIQSRQGSSLRRNEQDSLKIVIAALADSDETVWKFGQIPYQSGLNFRVASMQEMQSSLQYAAWSTLWTALTRQNGGSLTHDWVPQTLNVIESAISFNIPKVSIIPAIRQIGPKGGTLDDFSGVGLIDRLAEIQNPEHDKRLDRMKFDKINGFLQNVTGKHDAQIEIPYSREHVLVHMDDRVLPLESLGTGIHEVIMIAAFCTIADKQIVCIEEPEIHLHPSLQRKLIRYLAANTNNQYFIASHSAAFIDTPGAAIFHVYQEGGATRIREAILSKDRFAICQDLGYRASDIIQANSVIWVEGPSDRIYLNHWLKIAAPELVERVHYFIMFYGGRLLSHLSVNDEEVSEFIQLRDLNRNVAILIDSDKIGRHSHINETKRRIRDEFIRHGGIAWITKGREIENYIAHDRLQAAVKKVNESNYGKALAGGQFDHALWYERTAPKKTRTAVVDSDLKETKVDKIKVAHAIAADGSEDLSVLDLKERVETLVAMIRAANEA